MRPAGSSPTELATAPPPNLYPRQPSPPPRMGLSGGVMKKLILLLIVVAVVMLVAKALTSE
jgi:hypothetical protein